MKVIDYAHYKPVPTRKALILSAIDMMIQGLLFFAFLILAIAVLSLL